MVRRHPHAGSVCVPQDVGEGFQQYALDLQDHVRRQPLNSGQLIHLPVHFDARGRQARLQAVSQRGEHGGQVAIDGLHGIDRHAQFVERRVGMLAQLRLVGAALADQAEQPHQLRADAVVNVAHDALALQQRGMLRMLLLQQRVADLQFLLALAHLFVQRVTQPLVSARLARIAIQDEPAHEQHEQHGGQGQVRGPHHAFSGQAHGNEVTQARAEGNETRHTQRNRLGLAGQPRPASCGDIGKHPRQQQQRQTQCPEYRPL